METAEQRKFEEAIVSWLLKQNNLYDTRTRFMLLDIEEEYFDSPSMPCVTEGYSPPRLLSLRAFDRFFSEFPVQIMSSWLSQKQLQRTTFQKALTRLEHTAFGNDYYELFSGQHRAGDARPFAVVYHFPYQRNVTESLVMHNSLPIDDRVPGLHLFFRFEDEGAIMIETLDGFIASLQLKCPASRWMASAANLDYREPVTNSSDG